jgi:hypothetical protein
VDPEQKDPVRQSYAECQCGHQLDGVNPVLDFVHVGNSFVQRLNDISDTITAEMGAVYYAQCDGYQRVQKMIGLARTRESLSEYNRLMGPLLVEWKATVRRVWVKHESTIEGPGAVHSGSGTVRYIGSVNGAHRQELEESAEGTKGIIDMRLDYAGREALVGLIMAVRVATRLSLDPIGEVEMAMSVDGSLKQNRHCDGDWKSQFENSMVDVSPGYCRSHRFSTWVSTACGMGGVKGATRLPRDMSASERQFHFASLDLDQQRYPYKQIGAGYEDADHPGQSFNAMHPHGGPGYDEEHIEDVFAATLDQTWSQANMDGHIFTDTSVSFSSTKPNTTPVAVYVNELSTSGVWVDVRTRSEERGLRVQKPPRGTLHQRSVREQQNKLPLIPVERITNKDERAMTNMNWRCAGSVEAYETKLHFCRECPVGYHRRLRLYAGNVIVAFATPDLRAEIDMMLYIRWSWPSNVATECILTTMGGDAVVASESYDAVQIRLAVSPHPDADGAQYNGNIYATGHHTVKDQVGKLFANRTIFNSGPACSLSIDRPHFDSTARSMELGVELQHRVLHEGCGVLARAVPWDAASTRYVVWYPAATVPVTPPLICLYLRKGADALDEVTRPIKLHNPSTTYNWPSDRPHVPR